jgi:hypothetical protein
MERRDLFKILAATSVSSAPAQHEHATRAKQAAYQPRFFNQAEYELLDQLCETILPADEESGGAREARVAAYIDTVVLYADDRTQSAWRSGLAAIDRSARPEQVVSALLKNEESPANDAERFGVRLKAAVIEAWSSSEAGMKYFRYKGNGASYSFPGCTHASHKKA